MNRNSKSEQLVPNDHHKKSLELLDQFLEETDKVEIGKMIDDIDARFPNMVSPTADEYFCDFEYENKNFYNLPLK